MECLGKWRPTSKEASPLSRALDMRQEIRQIWGQDKDDSWRRKPWAMVLTEEGPRAEIPALGRPYSGHLFSSLLTPSVCLRLQQKQSKENTSLAGDKPR
jgi:hypothetical protein